MHLAAHAADYSLKQVEWNDDALYAETMWLRKQNPDVKILISVGGWCEGAVGGSFRSTASAAAVAASCAEQPETERLS